VWAPGLEEPAPEDFRSDTGSGATLQTEQPWAVFLHYGLHTERWFKTKESQTHTIRGLIRDEVAELKESLWGNDKPKPYHGLPSQSAPPHVQFVIGLSGGEPRDQTHHMDMDSPFQCQVLLRSGRA